MGGKRVLTFRPHTVGKANPPPVGRSLGLVEMPLDVAGEGPGGWRDALRQLGFDPERVRLGVLEREWQGHPRFAIVAAEAVRLAEGDRFAVSNEPGPPPR